MKVIKFIILGVVATLSVWRVSSLFRVNGATVDTIAVVSEQFDHKVLVEGYLQAARGTSVSATPPGDSQHYFTRYKIAWLQANGSQVKKNDPLVRFDPTTAKESLAKGKRKQKTIAIKIANAKLRRRNTIADHERKTQLAEVQYEYAQKQSHTQSEDIISRNDALKSGMDLQLAQAKATQAHVATRVERTVTAADIELLKIDRIMSKQEVVASEETLAHMTVVAPHNGVFIHNKRIAKIGNEIYSNTVVGQLPFVEKMEAVVFVLESDAVGLVPDAAATFFLESDNTTEHKARIKNVSPLAEPRGEDMPTKYFSVTLELEKTDTDLMKPGQGVQATLYLGSSVAMLLPRHCVFSADGNLFVYRRTGDKFEVVNVTLGYGTPGRVAVTGGLDSGDLIATSAPSSDDVLLALSVPKTVAPTNAP